MKIKNLPKTIYLQIGEDCDHDDWNKIYPSHEVTWCVDKINNNDIVYRLDKRRLGEPKARSNKNAGYRGKMTREEILKKTKYKFIEKNFDWLERTIEGLLNDFEGGITEKEETMHQFFVLIFDKLVAEIQELRDELSSQLEPPVSDDFCGDCGNKFEPGESRVYSGHSAVYGEYFPKSDTPICKKCAEQRYTEHRLKVEREIASQDSG